ncbi:MAG: DNA adenine methylase [Propionibacteriaceae bacterium]|nr:DNA adenine methylase [Propionibacteriaceae bacterium]
MTTLRAPFAYMGGKIGAAQQVWGLFGDPKAYVEPFCGSAGVLLNRPGGGRGRTEILNDMDGWLVNAWRAITHDPEQVARLCREPLMETNYHARRAWLHDHRDQTLTTWLEGHPLHYDTVTAAWWITAQSWSIGDPFEKGPWNLHQDHLVRTGDSGTGLTRKLPNITRSGGVYSKSMDTVAWLRALADRLTGVIVMCGDWTRVVKPSLIDRDTAVFLDPPYQQGGERYAHGSTTISDDVRQWCVQHTDHTIILCGYHTDHDELLDHGWARVPAKTWQSGRGKNRTVTGREVMWISPTLATGTHLLNTHAGAHAHARENTERDE